jgi:hypothetical protein
LIPSHDKYPGKGRRHHRAVEFAMSQPDDLDILYRPARQEF